MIQTVNIFTVLSVLLFLHAAWSDFRSWKIPNAAVLALVGLYAVNAAVALLTTDDIGAALFSFNGIGGDVGAGLLLFALGFALWLFRLFGAGDAKLFLPIGLFIGWHAMLPFAVYLLIVGVFTVLVLRLPMPLQLAHLSFFMRIEEIRATRKIPYGVIMVFAALAAIALRPAA
ncbi:MULTISPECIES: prepilin peptidase [unclassified Sinorhizobium]|uniref:prepilin peptidase n=1 Tax=unclassified Sinorhizobium TaxID=2613772 RepID=UPI0024C3EC2E|nr:MULTISPECIES: prepilin peptidase [unclassified Sinorhizobium]MDK1375451.1 prepilin peptidase [Sinorhizobium sp. 6-70]MDK1481837.1 prepilin peptidase [Sinorhizobium sp. 6-117]